MLHREFFILISQLKINFTRSEQLKFSMNEQIIINYTCKLNIDLKMRKKNEIKYQSVKVFISKYTKKQL